MQRCDRCRDAVAQDKRKTRRDGRCRDPANEAMRRPGRDTGRDTGRYTGRDRVRDTGRDTGRDRPMVAWSSCVGSAPGRGHEKTRTRGGTDDSPNGPVIAWLKRIRSA